MEQAGSFFGRHPASIVPNPKTVPFVAAIAAEFECERLIVGVLQTVADGNLPNETDPWRHSSDRRPVRTRRDNGSRLNNKRGQALESDRDDFSHLQNC